MKGLVVAMPACSTRVYRVIMSTCGVCTASGSKNSLDTVAACVA